MEENNNKNIENDMSNTFVAEVGQKSAIANNDIEELIPQNTATNFSETTNTLDSERPAVIPAENVNNVSNVNDLSDINNLANEDIPGFEKESTIYSEPKQKKTNPLLIILLIIIALAVGAGGSYYYFEILNQKEVNSQNTENKESKTDKVSSEELKLDSILVNSLIKRYDAYLLSSIEIYQTLYSKEKMLASEMSEDDIKYLAAKTALSMSDVKGKISFTSEQLHEAAQMLFGPSVAITDGDINLMANKQGVVFKYDNANQTYNYQAPDGLGGMNTVTMDRKTVKAVKNSDNIEITVVVAVLDSATNKVYKNYTDSAAYDEISDVAADNFDINNNYTDLNQYKYVFNYDTDNNNYYLESIELVK